MSVYAKVWAYDQHPLQVDTDSKTPKPGTRNPAAKAVLVALAEFPGVGQRECWPAQETISLMTDFDERTVRRHMAVLEAQGYIARKERRHKGHRLTDMVTLLGPIEAFGPGGKPPDRVSASKKSHRTECPEPPDRVSGEPSLEPSVTSEDKSSSGAQQADAPNVNQDYPAKTLTATTIERAEQVGFSPSTTQKANWGKGWARYVYVKEGEEPPPLEEQYAVLSEIVEAAAGKRGKGRFFLAVNDAVARVRGEVITLPDGRSRKEAEKKLGARPNRVKWEYGQLVVDGYIECGRRYIEQYAPLATNPEDAPPEWSVYA